MYALRQGQHIITHEQFLIWFVFSDSGGVLELCFTKYSRKVYEFVRKEIALNHPSKIKIKKIELKSFPLKTVAGRFSFKVFTKREDREVMRG